jgi:hypothetical protein
MGQSKPHEWQHHFNVTAPPLSVVSIEIFPMAWQRGHSWITIAGAFFGQDRDVKVPPHSEAVATTRCVFPHPVKLLALTGHYHFRGKEFTTNVWDGQTTGEQLYKFDGYTEPVFQRFSGKFQPEVPGLEWTCQYENDTDQEFTFGPFTDKNEHCNLFAFYYPTDTPEEDLTCVQKDGQVTVTVHDR